MDYFFIIDFVQSLADGLLFGTTYALIGIGFTLIFGVMRKLNLAYGAAALAGTYVGLGLFLTFNAPPFVVFLASAIGAGLIGLVVYYCCFRFTPEAHPMASLLASVGMLLFLEEMMTHVSHGMPHPYPSVLSGATLELGDIWIRGDLLFVFGICVVAMALLFWLLYRTPLGLATRAVSQQPRAAQLCGIDSARVNALTFVIAGVLGGTAGAMTAAAVGILSPIIATGLTVKGLIVVVIGGLGSIPGAIIGGLLVGAAENIFLLLRGVTERDIYVMLLLFLFLTLRPGGLFGSAATRD
ncbi:branched-chain amino acid ABC transporter permease [Ruegeria marina]|uniref:Branched-chain amino acid transport system permease protein n=1 Tax=Ruegeria marina TaxID=639004 RepID=A0A1G6TCT1_9RHOB|nr:branched-chain amino acid ABC transporter permease [Ruegeria marina]SDD26135.1 branched-chain amino acid transport system permease protein [Ruegeria marina]